jgi:hypothetical protein
MSNHLLEWFDAQRFSLPPPSPLPLPSLSLFRGTIDPSKAILPDFRFRLRSLLISYQFLIERSLHFVRTTETFWLYD